jgi:hypothetical protein
MSDLCATVLDARHTNRHESAIRHSTSALYFGAKPAPCLESRQTAPPWSHEAFFAVFSCQPSYFGSAVSCGSRKLAPLTSRSSRSVSACLILPAVSSSARPSD